VKNTHLPHATCRDTGMLVIAPSGRVTAPDRLPIASQYFARHAVHARLDSTTGQGFQRFGGTDAQRLMCLQEACLAPEQLVMLARGGYGLTRLLHKIDYAALRARQQKGQYWVGYSDFTTLQLAGLAKTAWVSIAGPTFTDEWADANPNIFTQENFWGLLNHNRWHASVPAQSSCGLAPENNPQGQWAGTLWGGNLAMVTSMLGTPYFPHIDRGILFLEDINEQPFRVERMLLQLHHAGVLDRQAAVVLGDFSGYTLGEHERGFNLQVMLETLSELTKTPIICGLPFGHCPGKLSLPVGGQCALTSYRDKGKPQLGLEFSDY
jgi:muramoyltetrapeptide carboxypeptidase